MIQLAILRDVLRAATIIAFNPEQALQILNTDDTVPLLNYLDDREKFFKALEIVENPYHTSEVYDIIAGKKFVKMAFM